MALLEADVNFKVVKQFVATVTERAIGSDVLESLTPAQMIVKIVNEELTALMGGENTKLTISPKPPTVVMLVGLNGAGKTTNGASRWTFRCSRWARLTRWTLPGRASSTPGSTATILCSSTPPADSTWTRS